MTHRRLLESRAASDFADPAREWRRVVAEIWGTFLLVLVAAGGAVAADLWPDKVSYGMAVVAPGLAVMAVIYTLGDVSGAHLNPAVTLAFAIRGNFPWKRVPMYVAGQLVGALLAAACLAFTFGFAGKLGATTPAPALSWGRALLLETLLTTGLVTTVLGSASGARNVGPNAAIAVGGYIALAGLWAGAATGASMNPARSLAPDLVTGRLADAWIYVVGPLLGAVAGVGVEGLMKGAPTRSGDVAAQGERTAGRDREDRR